MISKFRKQVITLYEQKVEGMKQYNYLEKLQLFPRCERLCHFCALKQEEDAAHFPFQYPKYNHRKVTLLSQIDNRFLNLKYLNTNNLFILAMINKDSTFELQCVNFLNLTLQKVNSIIVIKHNNNLHCIWQKENVYFNNQSFLSIFTS